MVVSSKELINLGVMDADGRYASYPSGDENGVDTIASNLDTKISPQLESLDLEEDIYQYLYSNKELLSELKNCSRTVIMNSDSHWCIQQN